MKNYLAIGIERAISFGGDGHVIEFGPGTLIERDGETVRVTKGEHVREFPWNRVLWAEPVYEVISVTVTKETPNAAQKRK